MNRSVLALLIFIVWSAGVLAHDLGNGLTITDAQVEQLKRELPKTTTESVFYHWTKAETALRWSMQGSLDRGEVDFYNKETGNLQAYGAGIYMAKSKTSSNGFGPVAVAFVMEAGTLLYNADKVQEVLGTSLSTSQMTKLGRLVPFIRGINNDWHITHHPETLDRIEWGERHGASPRWNEVNIAQAVNNLRRDYSRHGGVQYLESLIALSYYMDGISFLRANQVTNNPWLEFEPENFEKFRSFRHHVMGRLLNGEKLGLSTHGYFNSSEAGGTAESWARKQVEEILPDFWRRIAGRSTAPFRSEGIRAGGNREGRTFHATDKQLETLRSNPYISVEARPHPSGNGHLVNYFYPDVFHFEGIKDKLTPELVSRIESAGEQRLWQDSRLRGELNQEIVRELLVDTFKRNWNKPVNIQYGMDSVHLYRELISIHPFEDFNGRTMRSWLDTATLESGSTPPYSFLADLDLLVDAQTYKEILIKGTEAHSELVGAMLEELARAGNENRQPRYRELPEWKGLWKALEPIGVSMPESLTHEDYELIRTRRFNELFERIGVTRDADLGGGCRTVF